MAHKGRRSPGRGRAQLPLPDEACRADPRRSLAPHASKSDVLRVQRGRRTPAVMRSLLVRCTASGAQMNPFPGTHKQTLPAIRWGGFPASPKRAGLCFGETAAARLDDVQRSAQPSHAPDIAAVRAPSGVVGSRGRTGPQSLVFSSPALTPPGTHPGAQFPPSPVGTRERVGLCCARGGLGACVQASPC